MSSELQQFEQHLRDLLNNPPAPPKYKLWQMVVIQYSPRRAIATHTETKQGQIVGFYYSSVGIAFQNDSDPGWHYYVQVDFEHQIMLEENIEIEADHE